MGGAGSGEMDPDRLGGDPGMGYPNIIPVSVGLERDEEKELMSSVARGW